MNTRQKLALGEAWYSVSRCKFHLDIFPEPRISRCNPRSKETMKRLTIDNELGQISRWVHEGERLGGGNPFPRERYADLLAVHPDCAVDKRELAVLDIPHTARDYVARAPDRGDAVGQVKCGMTDGRLSISRANRFSPLAEKILRARIPRDVCELRCTRAPMIARGLPRISGPELKCFAGGTERLHHSFVCVCVYIRECCSRFSAKVSVSARAILDRVTFSYAEYILTSEYHKSCAGRVSNEN